MQVLLALWSLLLLLLTAAAAAAASPPALDVPYNLLGQKSSQLSEVARRCPPAADTVCPLLRGGSSASSALRQNVTGTPPEAAADRRDVDDTAAPAAVSWATDRGPSRGRLEGLVLVAHLLPPPLLLLLLWVLLRSGRSCWLPQGGWSCPPTRDSGPRRPRLRFARPRWPPTTRP